MQKKAREEGRTRILRRWEPEKGGTRVELGGSLGSENECERDWVDDEKVRRKGRARDMRYDRQRWWLQPWDEDLFCLCPPSKRRRGLLVGTVTHRHIDPCHARCARTSDHVLQTALQAVCAVRYPRRRTEARLQKSARWNRKACVVSCT